MAPANESRFQEVKWGKGMKIVRFFIGVMLIAMCVGLSPIHTSLAPVNAPAIYAQGGDQNAETKSSTSDAVDDKRIKLPSVKDMFKFGKPKPENLKKATGRNLFLLGLVLAGVLHQVLPFMFFAIGGTRLSGSRISILASIFFFILMTLWAIGVMMTTGQVIAWGIILLLIFVIWAALSRR